MLDTARIVAFVATRAPDKARQFYETTLGLRMVKDDPYALVFDANGTMLRITKGKAFSPQPFTVLGWHVDDIRAEVSRLHERGVTFMRFEGYMQDGDGIFWFPDGTQVAWFKDPDGNLLSLTQFAGK